MNLLSHKYFELTECLRREKNLEKVTMTCNIFKNSNENYRF